MTTFPGVFTGQYNISTGNVGLTYLGLGVGFLVGVFGSALFSDKILLSLSAKGDGEKKPEYRLPLMVWSSLLTPIGLFLYSWTAEFNLHFMIPITCSTLIGAGLLLIMVRLCSVPSFLAHPREISVAELADSYETAQMPLQTYLVDAYTVYAASALAASTVLRCVFGAVLPLAGEPLYNKLGLGWGNSLLGFIALALAPVPFLLSWYGERLRKKYPINF